MSMERKCGATQPFRASANVARVERELGGKMMPDDPW